MFKDRIYDADNNLCQRWNIWILTYIFIISKGFKDKTYGMPLIALCANISWEFIFSFIFPYGQLQSFKNYLWFVLETILVAHFLKHGKNEFIQWPSSKLHKLFIFLLAIEFGIILNAVLH
jgi:hypothetical protein